MKKVLFMLLCCTVFVIGCKKAPQDQVVTTEQVEATAVNSNDVLVSSNGVTNNEISSSTETVSQGEMK
jgi:PBP1b-binding outer membrane lipoprotein LpoB